MIRLDFIIFVLVLIQLTFLLQLPFSILYTFRYFISVHVL